MNGMAISYQEKHKERLLSSMFLVVASGDGYQSEIVRGDKLVDKVLEMIWGKQDSPPQAERDNYTYALMNPEGWVSEGDLGPCWWAEDFEDGQINVLRIADTKILDKADELQAEVNRLFRVLNEHAKSGMDLVKILQGQNQQNGQNGGAL